MKKEDRIEINKANLLCMICKEVCIRPMQSSCCDKLACLKCIEKLQLKTSNVICPSCSKVDSYFNENLLLARIIDSTMSKCDECEENIQFDKLNEHQLKEHEIDNSNSLYLNDKINLSERNVSNIHKHILVLAKSQNETKCSSHYYTKIPNSSCAKALKPGMKFYACQSCKLIFCLNCTNEKQYFFFIKEHNCPLELVYKDKGWRCNGIDLEEKCKGDKFTHNSEEKKMRYRCGKCDFDLCGSCYEFYSK